MVGRSLRYWAALDAFDSPWYQIAPLIGNGLSGAIIPLYSTVTRFGLLPVVSGGEDSSSIGVEALYDQSPAIEIGSALSSPTRTRFMALGSPANPPRPEVSSTRTAIRLRPDFATPAGTL